MRAIQKGEEPKSLTEHRSSGNRHFTPDYDNFGSVEDLRAALVRDQGAICCYCLQRIRPTEDGMKVEHWKCQSRFPQLQLTFSNMLGACLGGKGKPKRLQHCDTKKGNKDLSKNPANPTDRVEDFIRFLGDGTIESSDPTLNTQLTDVLNLNLQWISDNRKAVLDAFVERIRHHQGEFSREQLERWIASWNGDGGGARRPYCQIVVYWLRKKLARVER